MFLFLKHQRSHLSGSVPGSVWRFNQWEKVSLLFDLCRRWSQQQVRIILFKDGEVFFFWKGKSNWRTDSFPPPTFNPVTWDGGPSSPQWPPGDREDEEDGAETDGQKVNRESLRRKNGAMKRRSDHLDLTLIKNVTNIWLFLFLKHFGFKLVRKSFSADPKRLRPESV